MKTQNQNLKVKDKANNTRLCESRVDSTSGYDVNLKQKLETVDQDIIVFRQPGRNSIPRQFWDKFIQRVNSCFNIDFNRKEVEKLNVRTTEIFAKIMLYLK